MKRLTAFVLAAGLVAAATSEAAVFCAKRRDGGFNGSVKIREACKRGETQITPSDVGFCCTEASTTSTSTTTGTCPTYTSTTLGIPDCGGGGGACFGLCANAHACVPDAQTQACGCTGAPLPCNVVTYYGACGGTCPAGQTCALYGPPLPNGCPDVPRCACVLE